METKILRVVQQTAPISVPSNKSEDGQVWKCTIVLQELGGRYADTYVATMLASTPQSQLNPGDFVAANLRCSAHEHEGRYYQDVIASEIVKL